MCTRCIIYRINENFNNICIWKINYDEYLMQTNHAYFCGIFNTPHIIALTTSVIPVYYSTAQPVAAEVAQLLSSTTLRCCQCIHAGRAARGRTSSVMRQKHNLGAHSFGGGFQTGRPKSLLAFILMKIDVSLTGDANFRKHYPQRVITDRKFSQINIRR